MLNEVVGSFSRSTNRSPRPWHIGAWRISVHTNVPLPIDPGGSAEARVPQVALASHRDLHLVAFESVLELIATALVTTVQIEEFVK